METKTTKFCTHCGEEIDINCTKCPKCGKAIKEVRDSSIKKPVYKKWWFWLLIIVVIGAIGGSAGNSKDKTKKAEDNKATITNANSKNIADAEIDNNEDSMSETLESSDSNSKYTLGDTFTFDDLEITLGKKCSFVKVDNQFAEENGKDVIKLPVEIKNVGTEKNRLNMFYYKVFGSKGTELDSITAYFDDAVDFAGELKPGASYKSYLYLLYDGKGTYSIDFDNYDDEISVEFNIKK